MLLTVCSCVCACVSHASPLIFRARVRRRRVARAFLSNGRALRIIRRSCIFFFVCCVFARCERVFARMLCSGMRVRVGTINGQCERVCFMFKLARTHALHVVTHGCVIHIIAIFLSQVFIRVCFDYTRTHIQQQSASDCAVYQKLTGHTLTHDAHTPTPTSGVQSWVSVA